MVNAEIFTHLMKQIRNKKFIRQHMIRQRFKLLQQKLGILQKNKNKNKNKNKLQQNKTYMNVFLIIFNTWISSSKNVTFKNNILQCELQNNNGNFNLNKLEIHPLLLNKKLINDNGSFKYILSKKEDDTIMNLLFPVYKGPTIPHINIYKCTILSVDIPKYNNIRNETIAILNNYKLPPINIHFGYTPETVQNARFYEFMYNKQQTNYHTLGMLEIFDNFVKENSDENRWLLYFEDDVRPINIKLGDDLSILYNVPSNAEFIRPYIGKNEPCDIQHLKYNTSYSGGYNHAFYISVSGCKKVLHYAKKYKWKYICDIDLYKLAKYCGGHPTGLDGWTLKSTNNNNDIALALNEDEKINMYQLSHVIFNQTSLPCV